MGASSIDKKEKIEGIESLRPYFYGRQKKEDLRIGAELEVQLMVRTKDGHFRLPTDYENLRLTEIISDPGPDDDETGILSKDDFSNEPPASMIEIKTRPHTHDHNVVNQIETHLSVLTDKASRLEITQEELDETAKLVAAQKSELRLPKAPLYQGELFVCPFAVIPFAKKQELICNIISPRGEGHDYSDRPRLMMRSFNDAMIPEAVSYPVANSAVHFTHGVKNLKHAFEMSRLQAAMMPFMMVLTENRPPYQDGSDERVMTHTGIDVHLALNVKTEFNNAQRGLTPDILWESSNAGEFVKKMLQTVLETPMLAYWNDNYDFTPVERGQKVTPVDMQGLGPENISQFELALSQFWWSFKYKFHPKNKGALLHELRDFDSGIANVNNVTRIMAMLSLDKDTRAKMIELLEDKYGIPLMSDPMTAKKVIEENMEGARHRGDEAYHPHCGGRHLQAPFGTNGGTMLSFLREDLLPMLENYYQGTRGEKRLDTLRFIAQTGMTDTQLWYDCFDSAEEQTQAMLAMTEDPHTYNDLLQQGKSWAQLQAEGKTPFLQPKDRKQTAEKTAKPAAKGSGPAP